MNKKNIIILILTVLLLTTNICNAREGFVGIQLSKDYNQPIIIKGIIKGTSAYDNKLKSNDKILKINDVETTNLSTEQAISMLKGENGTSVKVLIDSSGSKKEVVLVRKSYANAGLKIKKDGKYAKIMYVYPTSGAFMAGIKAGDYITSINKKSVGNLSEKDINALLNGFSSSKKLIGINRNGVENIIKVTINDKFEYTDFSQVQLLYPYLSQYQLFINNNLKDLNQRLPKSFNMIYNITIERNGRVSDLKFINGSADIKTDINQFDNMLKNYLSPQNVYSADFDYIIIEISILKNNNDLSVNNRLVKTYKAPDLAGLEVLSKDEEIALQKNNIPNEQKPNIKFFGNLSYNTGIIEFIQKFNSYTTVSNISINVKGMNKEVIEDFTGVDLEKLRNSDMDEKTLFLYGLQMYGNVMTNMANLPALLMANPQAMHELEKNIKTHNLKNHATTEELKTTLSNLYNANKKYLMLSVDKLENKDSKTIQYFGDDIIVEADKVVINGIPFHVKATFTLSKPYLKHEYNKVTKTANGIYWGHTLKELILTSNENLTENNIKQLINTYSQKYPGGVTYKDNTLANIEGKHINIDIDCSSSVRITYKNLYNFDNIYEKKLQDEKLRKQNEYYKQYQNINMKKEI